MKTIVVYDEEDARDSFWSCYESKICRLRQLVMPPHSYVPSSKHEQRSQMDEQNAAQSWNLPDPGNQKHQSCGTTHRGGCSLFCSALVKGQKHMSCATCDPGCRFRYSVTNHAELSSAWYRYRLNRNPNLRFWRFTFVPLHVTTKALRVHRRSRRRTPMYHTSPCSVNTHYNTDKWFVHSEKKKRRRSDKRS